MLFRIFAPSYFEEYNVMFTCQKYDLLMLYDNITLYFVCDKENALRFSSD